MSPIATTRRAAIGPPRPVPADLLAVLRENSPEFAATLDHHGGPPHWSTSEYDMSIASQLARAGFDDQTVADIIACHRLLHDPSDRKAHRLDYLERTIIRAGGGSNSTAAAPPSWPPGWASLQRPPLAVLDDYVRRTIARARGAEIADLGDEQETDVAACFALVELAGGDDHIRAQLDDRRASGVEIADALERRAG
jgi:hypothetical protein